MADRRCSVLMKENTYELERTVSKSRVVRDVCQKGIQFATKHPDKDELRCLLVGDTL